MTAGCKNIFICLLLLFACFGCVMEEGGYQDSRIYNNALSGLLPPPNGAAAIVRNPIIIIHGLLGSQLRDKTTGETVWGVFSPSSLHSGKFNRQLMHPAGLNKSLAELNNNVVPEGLLARSEIQLLGVSFYLSNYEILLNSLEQAGFVAENNASENALPSLCIFAYDWRRDISENAVLLDAFIAVRKKILQDIYRQRYGIVDYDVQFDIVAHSMGGLLANYYLRYGGVRFPDDPSAEFPVTWAGSANIDKVVMIGTPNAGYADALLEACSGLKLSSYAPVIPAAVTGSFPSLYQMMPDIDEGTVVWLDDTERNVDIWDIEIWKQFGWGLAGDIDSDLQKLFPDVPLAAERREIALDHLQKCLRRGKLFRKHMRCQPEAPPEDVKIFLIAGDALETNRTIGIDRNGKMHIIAKDHGDGKITCASARYDLNTGGEWMPFARSPIQWSGVCYLPGGHMGIMNSPVFNSNLANILTSWPSRAQLNTWERLQ